MAQQEPSLKCMECGGIKSTYIEDGGWACWWETLCSCERCAEPTLFERLAIPTHEEFELLTPEEQSLMLQKASAELAKATEAEVASAVKAMEANAEAKMKVVEAEAKKTIKLKLKKKKKPIKLKLKLKKEC